MRHKKLVQLSVVYMRFLLGAAFVFSGIPKLQGKRFTGTSGEYNPINSAWHFFETLYRSGIYWEFLGWSQLIAGMLLMTQRYARAGLLLYAPLMLNVLVITLTYNFPGTLLVTSTMSVAILLLIIWDWQLFRFIVNLPVTYKQEGTLVNNCIWEICGWCMFLFTVTYRLAVPLTNASFWLAGLFFFGISAFAFYQLHSGKKAKEINH